MTGWRMGFGVAGGLSRAERLQSPASRENAAAQIAGIEAFGARTGRAHAPPSTNAAS
jgi:hypothetical protein